MPYLRTSPLNYRDKLVLEVLDSSDNPEGVWLSELSEATGFKQPTILSMIHKLICNQYAFQRFGVTQYCITASGREALHKMTAATEWL